MSTNQTASTTTTRPDPPQPPPAQAGGEPTQDAGGGKSSSSGGRGTDRGRRPIGWGLALIAAGTLWLLSVAGVTVRWELVLPVALVGIGGALLVGGRWTARGGWIGLGVVVAVLALAASTTPSSPSVSAGDRSYTVVDVSDLEESYSLGAGSLTIDLRGLELPEGTTELSAGVSMGDLVVRVPPEVTIDGEASVVMGEVVAFDQSRSGVTPSLSFTDAGADPDRQLSLDLQVGLGRIEVTR